MKRLLSVLAASSLLLGLAQGAVLAANPAHIDQENDVGSDSANDAGHTFAQTFTVGHAGKLSSVDLWLGGGGAISIDIEHVDGSDHPDGTSIASGSATAPATADWVNFALGTSISVAVGDRLAIVFTTAEGPYVYGSNNGDNSYAGGTAYWYNPATPAWEDLDNISEAPTDLAFRTYVDPVSTPTPAKTSTVEGSASSGGQTGWLLPIGLVASCCGAVLLIARRRAVRVS